MSPTDDPQRPREPWNDPPPARPQVPDRFMPLGLVVGSLCWLVVFTATFLVLSRTLDAGPATLVTAVGWGGVAAGLLASPKTRRAGSGMLLGLAVSFIVWGGVCAVMGVSMW